MKAEELYHKLIEDYDELNYMAEKDGIDLLKQYVDKQSKENAVDFFKDTAHRPKELDIPTVEELYNDWLKQQEGE